MLAIPPNRQFAANRQTGGRTCLLTRSMCITAALALLVGMSQRGWSDSQPIGSNSDLTESGAKQSSAAEQKPQQNAIRLVVTDQLPAAKKATSPQQPAPAVQKPTAAPPLAVADYKNYIKDFLVIPRTAVLPAPEPSHVQNVTQVPVPSAPKNLATIAPVESTESTAKIISSPIAVESPKHNSDKAAAVAEQRPEKNVTFSDKLPVANDYQPEMRSIALQRRVRDANSYLAAVPAPAPAPEAHVAMLEQAPESRHRCRRR